MFGKSAILKRLKIISEWHLHFCKKKKTTTNNCKSVLKPTLDEYSAVYSRNRTIGFFRVQYYLLVINETDNQYKFAVKII